MTDQEDYLEKHWSGDSIEQELCVRSIEPYGEILEVTWKWNIFILITFQLCNMFDIFFM